MQVHKIVLMVIDFDDIGQQGAIEALENAMYPNRCISPTVLSADSRDCGEWSDQHPLNKRSEVDAEMERLFSNQ